jgi:hypothetical protein
VEEVEKNKVLIGVLEILVEEVVKNKVLIEELEILVEEVVQNKVLIEELEILNTLFFSTSSTRLSNSSFQVITLYYSLLSPQ